jgi:hypothetical protein
VNVLPQSKKLKQRRRKPQIVPSAKNRKLSQLSNARRRKKPSASNVKPKRKKRPVWRKRSASLMKRHHALLM